MICHRQWNPSVREGAKSKESREDFVSATSLHQQSWLLFSHYQGSFNPVKMSNVQLCIALSSPIILRGLVKAVTDPIGIMICSASYGKFGCCKQQKSLGGPPVPTYPFLWRYGRVAVQESQEKASLPTIWKCISNLRWRGSAIHLVEPCTHNNPTHICMYPLPWMQRMCTKGTSVVS